MLSVLNTRFTMSATLLHQGEYVQDDIDLDEYGEWVVEQDWLSGDIIRVWKPFPDDTNTDQNETVVLGEIKCLARGIISAGVAMGGTSEKIGLVYDNIDYIRMWTPPKYSITKRDRITNIRDPHGRIVWRDEEFERNPDDVRASVFNVNGVTPEFDPWNRHIQNYVLLERVDDLGGGEI
jgi:hypothetical protein